MAVARSERMSFGVRPPCSWFSATSKVNPYFVGIFLRYSSAMDTRTGVLLTSAPLLSLHVIWKALKSMPFGVSSSGRLKVVVPPVVIRPMSFDDAPS